jgi:hypothetical protein
VFFFGISALFGASGGGKSGIIMTPSVIFRWKIHYCKTDGVGVAQQRRRKTAKFLNWKLQKKTRRRR